MEQLTQPTANEQVGRELMERCVSAREQQQQERTKTVNELIRLFVLNAPPLVTGQGMAQLKEWERQGGKADLRKPVPIVHASSSGTKRSDLNSTLVPTCVLSVSAASVLRGEIPLAARPLLRVVNCNEFSLDAATAYLNNKVLRIMSLATEAADPSMGSSEQEGGLYKALALQLVVRPVAYAPSANSIAMQQQLMKRTADAAGLLHQECERIMRAASTKPSTAAAAAAAVPPPFVSGASTAASDVWRYNCWRLLGALCKEYRLNVWLWLPNEGVHNKEPLVIRGDLSCAPHESRRQLHIAAIMPMLRQGCVLFGSVRRLVLPSITLNNNKSTNFTNRPFQFK